MTLKMNILNIQSFSDQISRKMKPENPLKQLDDIYLHFVKHDDISLPSLSRYFCSSFFLISFSSSGKSLLNFRITIGPLIIYCQSNLLSFQSLLFVQYLLSPLECKFHKVWIETVLFTNIIPASGIIPDMG